MNERQSYNANGYVHLKAFFDKATVARVREDAKAVFVRQLCQRGLLPSRDIPENQFETALYQFFRDEREGFVNCGKTCQHLISLHSVEDDWYRTIEGTLDHQYVPVEVEAGDALFFSAFLVHRSGDNITDSIRWSCHFRYNDLEEETFIQQKYPNPYTYKPEQELITKDFPQVSQLKELFARPV